MENRFFNPLSKKALGRKHFLKKRGLKPLVSPQTLFPKNLNLNRYQGFVSNLLLKLKFFGLTFFSKKVSFF